MTHKTKEPLGTQRFPNLCNPRDAQKREYFVKMVATYKHQVVVNPIQARDIPKHVNCCTSHFWRCKLLVEEKKYFSKHLLSLI